MLLQSTSPILSQQTYWSTLQCVTRSHLHYFRGFQFAMNSWWPFKQAALSQLQSEESYLLYCDVINLYQDNNKQHSADSERASQMQSMTTACQGQDQIEVACRYILDFAVALLWTHSEAFWLPINFGVCFCKCQVEHLRNLHFCFTPKFCLGQFFWNSGLQTNFR